MRELPCTATGAVDYYFPPGDKRDHVMGLVRLGQAFGRQHCGRKPGFLHHYICGIVAGMEKPTFANLLAELDLAAARRDAGDDHEPIERVSRSFELLTFHDPRAGRCQIALGTLRDYLTAAKKAKTNNTGHRLYEESALVNCAHAVHRAAKKQRKIL